MDTDHPSSSLNSTTSSHGSMDSVRQSLMDCHLLSKILRLANPGRASSDGEGPKVCNQLLQLMYYLQKLIMWNHTTNRSGRDDKKSCHDQLSIIHFYYTSFIRRTHVGISVILILEIQWMGCSQSIEHHQSTCREL